MRGVNMWLSGCHALVTEGKRKARKEKQKETSRAVRTKRGEGSSSAAEDQRDSFT